MIPPRTPLSDCFKHVVKIFLKFPRGTHIMNTELPQEVPTRIFFSKNPLGGFLQDNFRRISPEQYFQELL